MARKRETYQERITRLMAEGFTRQQAAGHAPKSLSISQIRKQAKQQNISVKEATNKALLRSQRRATVLKSGVQRRIAKFQNGNTHRIYRVPPIDDKTRYISEYRGKAYGVFAVVSLIVRNERTGKREVVRYQTSTIFLRGVPSDEVNLELIEELEEMLDKYGITIDGIARYELVFITGKSR